MYIGLDLGTSGLKAILCDEAGAVLDAAENHYENPHPKSGWSEQDPADWIAACETAFDAFAARHPAAFAAVKGIGLSGQMHGATLVDSKDHVLRPCMLWNDTRAAEQAAWLDAQPQMRDITGNIVFPGFTAPKVMWLEKNEPELFAQIAKVLLPKDYLRLWLTGEHVGEMSDAAGTSWLDVGKRDWSDAALATSNMRRDQMPRLCEGNEPSGEMRKALRDRWGITGPVVIAGGAGDNAAAACGAGCFEEGQGFVSLGTSGVLLAAKDTFAPDPATAVHTFCHAVPQTWYQMGVILAATDCMNWLSRSLGQSPAELAGLLPDNARGPSDLMFLPYLSGERTPHNDARVRGAFIGLDVSHGPADLTQAVIEGVCFALRDCLAALEGTGTRFSSVLAMGGGARSAFWRDTLATVLDVPLSIPAGGEFGAAQGAARLGMAAAGAGALQEIMTQPKIGSVQEPNPALAAQYQARWKTWRKMYPAITDALGSR